MQIQRSIFLVFALAAMTASALAQSTDDRTLIPWTDEPWTDEEVLARTVNPSREHQFAPWPPHRIVGSTHYVGTRNLGAFLITTSEGHILVNTTFEETLPLIRDSVEELGFEWQDIEIVLGSHAHRDHMSGNALMKEQTGARVMAMAEDIPLLVEMTPEDKPHAIDRVLRHGDTVTLGEVTMTAHLTPGHTPGATAWTYQAEEDGETYDVLIFGAATATPRFDLSSPELQAQFQRAFLVQRGLPCDVPLGPHVPMYNMEAKYEELTQNSDANPFIDPEGCEKQMAYEERVFYLRYREFVLSD